MTRTVTPFTLPGGAQVAPRTDRPFAVVILTQDGLPCGIIPCRTAPSAVRRAEAMRGLAIQLNPMTRAWEALAD